MADYISSYSGAQIDEAVGRALPGGRLEVLIADNAPQNWGFGVDRLPLINKETLDARFDTGMYMFYDVVNTIDGIRTGQVFIRGRNSNIGYYVVQDIWTPDSGGSASVHLHRYKVSADSDWVLEYENPPMVLGKEYRTTERYLGKPVYAKRIHIPALPNAALLSVDYSDDENCRAIRANGVAENSSRVFPTLNFGGALADSFGNANVVSLTTANNKVLIACGGDRSNSHAYISVFYYKTTD